MSYNSCAARCFTRIAMLALPPIKSLTLGVSHEFRTEVAAAFNTYKAISTEGFSLLRYNNIVRNTVLNV